MYRQRDGYATLIPPDRERTPSIQIEDWGADGVMITVGQLVSVLADDEDDPNDRDNTPYAVELVERIMDGGAVETAHVLDGELLALSWSIESGYRGADNTPELPPGTQHYSRRIAPWRNS